METDDINVSSEKGMKKLKHLIPILKKDKN